MVSEAKTHFFPFNVRLFSFAMSRKKRRFWSYSSLVCPQTVTSGFDRIPPWCVHKLLRRLNMQKYLCSCFKQWRSRWYVETQQEHFWVVDTRKRVSIKIGEFVNRLTVINIQTFLCRLTRFLQQPIERAMATYFSQWYLPWGVCRFRLQWTHVSWMMAVSNT